MHRPHQNSSIEGSSHSSSFSHPPTTCSRQPFILYSAIHVQSLATDVGGWRAPFKVDVTLLALLVVVVLVVGGYSGSRTIQNEWLADGDGMYILNQTSSPAAIHCLAHNSIYYFHY